jgi:hypothetical protein
MSKFKEFIFKKLNINQKEEEEELKLVYTKIPMTLELKKRQYLEEQTEKYGIKKEKKCTII